MQAVSHDLHQVGEAVGHARCAIVVPNIYGSVTPQGHTSILFGRDRNDVGENCSRIAFSWKSDYGRNGDGGVTADDAPESIGDAVRIIARSGGSYSCYR